MRPNSAKFVLQRVGDGSGPGGDVQLHQDIGDVAADGVLAQDQSVSDLLVAQAPAQQLEHLRFARAENGGTSRPGELVGPGHLRCNSQAPQGITGYSGLVQGGVSAAQGVQRASQIQAGLGRVEG